MSSPTTMYRNLLAFLLLSLLAVPLRLSAQETRLLRQPDLSDEHIVFSYARDLWICARAGGEARRLTSFTGQEGDPHFSPDGRWIAFTGQYDGNTDVYLVSVHGGEPKRLTWHPGADIAKGWTPDGKKIIFASGRTNVPLATPNQFWTVSPEGGIPQQLPVPRVAEGMLSSDGAKMAYQMVLPWESEFRNYRGGQANPIRLIDLKSSETTKLPWNGSNDQMPVWIDNEVFFLSDRDFAMNIWSYNVSSGKLTQRTFFKDFDCKNLEANHNTLIFENGGYLQTLAAKGGTPQKVSIRVEGDFPWVRPHWKKVADQINAAEISPTGKRALLEARGEIFTVPADKGDIRNLTQSSGAADRAPAWSPDGQHISWFSDESGEYQLVIADQYGENARKIALPNPTFYYTPVWSPDSKYLSFGDADRQLWIVDVESGQAKAIDNEGFAHPVRTIYPAWSPDSRWIAYTKRPANEYNTIFVYSVEEGKTYQFTDGMSDCQSPAWDKSGKYLYFTASTDYGLNVGWLDMSSIERPLNRAVYLAVLSATELSPLKPESDDEEVKEEKKEGENGKTDGEGKEETIKVTIDFQGLGQRILSLGVPARPYSELSAGEEGTLFFMESVQNQPGNVLHRYTLKDREAKEVMRGILGYRISHDGKKLLYAMPGNQLGIVDAGGSPKPGDGALKTGDLQMKVDPMAEWKQIFREAWRYQRDYFYVDNVHGLDLKWAYDTYAPWVEHVRHRDDLNHLLDILGGETSIGHSFNGGGDYPSVESVPVGLLGADYAVNQNRYRFARIYNGENWNPELQAPLTQPGVNVREGDYLLAVNGVELTAADNLYRLFDRTAGKQTVLTVNTQPTLTGSRKVTVVPVGSESGLRRMAWVEDNRRKVDELSNGQLAYVWLPDTGEGGYSFFNRYYFAQKNKKGAVIDERFNGGGYIADYIVDLLSRDLMGYFNNPLGDKQPWTAPNAAIWGPKVMIINESAGSGGDMLPFMFHKKGIGPLVGTRTWGGLVGIWDVPGLIDGGGITAPRGGFYNVDGEWDVENEGIAPDIEVEQDPKLVNQGRDPQLEKAVEKALELLKAHPFEPKPQPADPVRVKRPKK